MALIALLLGSIWYAIEGFEVVGNYKFWDSISDSIIYDYSGNQNHMEYGTKNFYYTDRGIMIYGPSTLRLPSNSMKEYPGYKDFMLSYWYLRKDSQSSRALLLKYSNCDLRLLIETSTGNTNITLDSFSDSIRYFHQASININDKWMLYTFKVTQNSSNTESTITIYIDLNYITLFTITSASLSSTSSIGIGGNSALIGIVYEMWWHKDVSNISDIEHLLISSSSCNCSYSCVASPTILCLPNYDSTYNSLGRLCSSSCPYSCNKDLECISNSKPECVSGLYHIESSNCLLYCPDNSCIFEYSLGYNCKIGYKQVSDNPLACIPSQCIFYERVYYNKYICYECEVGYIPDSLGELCICDTEYTAVSSNPLICINIARCIAYIKKEDKYLCSSCSEGYKIDSDGNCNECDLNYVQVLDDPFTCVEIIDNCYKYTLNDTKSEWECELCIKGYSLDIDKLCKVEYDFTVEVCESGNYLPDGLCNICPITCKECDILHSKNQCISCKEGYTAVIINKERVCLLCSIDNQICSLDTNTTDESVSDNSLEDNENSSNSDEDSNSSTTIEEESSNSSDNLLISQSSIIFQTVAIVSLVVSVVSMNYNNFFATLGTTEILSFILMYNLDIPNRAKAVIQGMDILNIIPNIFEYLIHTRKTLHETRYNRAEYESEYFLINSGKYLTVIICMISIYLVFKLLSKLLVRAKKLETLMKKLIVMLEWNMMIEYSIQMYLEITISSLLNIVNYSHIDAASTINLAISVIALCFYAPIKYLSFIIKNHARIEDDSLGSKYTTLYSNFQSSNIDSLLFNLMSMIRRLVYGINMVFLHNSPYIQVILNSSISWSLIVYLIKCRPYKTRIMNIISIYQEVNIFIILSMLGSILIPGISGILYDIIDWAMTVLLYASILVPICINLFCTIRNCILKSKRNKEDEIRLSRNQAVQTEENKNISK